MLEALAAMVQARGAGAPEDLSHVHGEIGGPPDFGQTLAFTLVAAKLLMHGRLGPAEGVVQGALSERFLPGTKQVIAAQANDIARGLSPMPKELLSPDVDLFSRPGELVELRREATEFFNQKFPPGSGERAEAERAWIPYVNMDA